MAICKRFSRGSRANQLYMKRSFCIGKDVDDWAAIAFLNNIDHKALLEGLSFPNTMYSEGTK